MNNNLVIKSAVSERELVFADINGEYFSVQLRGDLCVRLKVYGFSPSGLSIESWFNELGSQSAPWKNDICWESLEGELTLAATCDSLGHVVFTIELFQTGGGEESFSVKTGLQIELGQLKKLSEVASVFFNPSST